MNQAAIKGLGLIGDKLNQEEIPQKNRLPHQQNSPQQSRRSRRSRSPYDEAPQIGVKTERIISDRPTDRTLTELKNGFGRIVAGYGHGYG
jgi:hypothetical protein